MTTSTLQNGVSAQRNTARLAGWVVLAIVLIALPFVIGQAGQSWVRIANFALLYVMLALGLNITVGFAGLLDLGYIAFYAVGAYTWALLASPHFGLHLPFWLVIPIAVAVAGMFGLLLGIPTLKLKGDYLAIVTLGFCAIIGIFLRNLNAPFNITNGPQGINRIDSFQVGDFNFGRASTIFDMRFTGPEKYYFLLLFMTLLIVLVSSRLQNSRVGRALEAVREDEIAAKAMGINIRNVKLLAFATGAMFAGLAGSMFASMQGFVSPESFSLPESISVLCMVVLGGMGHIPGVIIGAIILAILPEFLRAIVVPVQQTLFGDVIVDPEGIRMLLFGLAMVLVMLFRPAGLWPSAVRKRELSTSKGEGR
ncbi:MAG: ABC transporter ATP-binding protein [Corticimicrobacter sp.]|uniref:ABC transporter permease subunit n=1 Tax=Corticimicrobacter sp. TaxID=2678536 RepID=UPI0032D9B55A